MDLETQPTELSDRALAPSTLLSGIVDALPSPVVVKDARHRWILANQLGCAMVGRPREELLGRSEIDFLPIEVARACWAHDDAVLSTGETGESEERYEVPGRGPRTLLARKSLHHDEAGHPLLLCVFTDLTVRAETEALRREQHFRQLADLLPQVIWTARLDGTLDFINRRTARYAGARLEQALGTGWLELVHPDDRDRVARRWARSVQSGKPFEVQYRLRTTDGSYHWALVRACKGRTPEGDVRWFGVVTDIQAQKDLEAALREEDRRKDDFVAMLGHELRNPLTPIRNAVQLLQRAELPPGGRERAVGMVDRQVARITRLIDDVLDLSRITRGKLVLRRDRFDLREPIRTLLDDRREELAAQGLRLEAELPPEPVWLDGDRARIAQAAGNLLENAVHHTDRGGAVRVALRGDAGQARLDVSHTGIGLRPDVLERIFVPFTQVEGDAGRRGGLGLGLSLVRLLAELHGGRVEARSEGRGRGACFTLRLPLAAAPAPAPSPPRPTAAAEGSDPAHGLRILVVEDNADAAETLQLLLELEGHQVKVAGTAEDGLARARADHPDVVLSDIGLPGMSGYDLARRLRADPDSPRLVAISGYGQARDREEAFQSGFEHHLTKPFDLDRLRQVLASMQSGTG